MNLTHTLNPIATLIPKHVAALAVQTLIVSSALIISGCVSNLDSKTTTDSPLKSNVSGICHITDNSPPIPTTKADCFAKRGLFEQTDNPQAAIAAAAKNQAYNRTINPPVVIDRNPTPTAASTAAMALTMEADAIAAKLAKQMETEIKEDIKIESNPDEGFTIETVEEEVKETPKAVAKKVEEEVKPVKAKTPVKEETKAPVKKATSSSSDSGSDPEVDCYLTGADTPFRMEKSVCLDGGGSLEKP
jgi:hypothetical protein